MHSQSDSTEDSPYIGTGDFEQQFHGRTAAATVILSGEGSRTGEDQRMIGLRVAVPAVLAAAAVAGWFTYVVAPPAPVEADKLSPPIKPDLTVPDARASTNIDQIPSTKDTAAQAYREAAEAILRRAPNARASTAGANDLPITGPIPLPKRRPLIAP